MKTISAKPETVRRDWYLVNAEGKTLGRLATALAHREGGSVEEWRRELRALLEGDRDPSLDLLTRIDVLLAGPRPRKDDDSSQTFLFGG